RIADPRLHGKDAVLGGVARRNRVNHLLAVHGEGELHHIGDGALECFGQIAHYQVRAELRPRAATTCTRRARRRAAASAAATLLIAFPFRRRRRRLGPLPNGRGSDLLIAFPFRRRRRWVPRTARWSVRTFLEIHQQPRRLLRHREALHPLHPRRLAGGEIDNHHAILRRRLLVLLGLVALRLRGEGRKHHGLAVRREPKNRAASFRRRSFLIRCRRRGRGTQP